MKNEFKNLIECWKLYNRASKLLTDAMGGTANIVGEFVVVLFSNAGDVLKAIEMDKDAAKKLAKPDKHQNGEILTTSSKLLNHERAIDITTSLQQLINSSLSTSSK